MNASASSPSSHPLAASTSGEREPLPARIIVGVGGGIAAYKSCMLIREFKAQGHDVHVLPTENALRFVGAATFEALSGNSVDTSVFEKIPEVNHVRQGKLAQLIVIAPATADLIARLAHGRADDLLTSTVLMAQPEASVVIAPAMHTEMWRHPATQDNVQILRARGVIVLEPASGRLTGPDSGPGRLLDPEQIAALSLAVLAGVSFERSLEGRRVVITAGGTREALDPVRYLGNRSSGKQGFAFAELAAQLGADVHLIAAHTDELPTPAGAHVERVSSARELETATVAAAADADAVIMVAAVADVRPKREEATKMKKDGDHAGLETLDLVENPDILAGLSRARAAGELPADLAIVGFAAETGDDTATPLEHAKRKFLRKGCDLMMCNEVGAELGFGQSRNSGWLLERARGEAGERSSADVVVTDVAEGSKIEVAGAILARLAAFLQP